MTELEAALRGLERSSRDFLATMDGVSGEHYLMVPAPGRWSLAENAEHTTVVLRGVERLFTTLLLNQPLAPDDPRRRVIDVDLPRYLADRSLGVQAPERVRPTGRWTTREEMTAALNTTTAGIVVWASGISVSLRACGAPHPLLGPLDGIQWIRFLALHTDRHAEQAREIRRQIGEKGAGSSEK